MSRLIHIHSYKRDFVDYDDLQGIISSDLHSAEMKMPAHGIIFNKIFMYAFILRFSFLLCSIYCIIRYVLNVHIISKVKFMSIIELTV